MKIICKNKKAYFDYEVLFTYMAGIALEGNEVKSIKNGDMSIGESFCKFNGNELFLYNSNVAVYKQSSMFNTMDPLRARKLLLTKHELQNLKKNVEIKGNTIVPLEVFINDKGLVKVTIGLCKGKHNYDKRESIKQRDVERENNRKF